MQIGAQLSLSSPPRDAVLKYERLRERGWAGISASAVFKITPFQHIHLSESWCASLGLCCRVSTVQD